MRVMRKRSRTVRKKHSPRISRAGAVSESKTKVRKWLLVLLCMFWSCCTLMQDDARESAAPWQPSAGLRQGAGWLICSRNWRWHLECAITHIPSFLISASPCNPAAPATIYCWGRRNSARCRLGLNFITQTHTHTHISTEHPTSSWMQRWQKIK